MDLLLLLLLLLLALVAELMLLALILSKSTSVCRLVFEAMVSHLCCLESQQQQVELRHVKCAVVVAVFVLLWQRPHHAEKLRTKSETRPAFSVMPVPKIAEMPLP